MKDMVIPVVKWHYVTKQLRTYTRNAITRFNAVAIEKSSDQPKQYQYGTSFTAGPELCLSARMEMYGVTIFRNAP